MKKKQLIDSLLKNWPAKIICFVIAIFLYLFYQASLIDKKTFVIPLEIHENGIVVHVGKLPSSVVVNVRSNENDMKSIFASDMSAYIDLTNIAKSGKYKLPINVVISDKLRGLDPLEVKLKVETLDVVLERKVSRYVKVVPSVVGEVANDYFIKEIKMDPSTVEIEGPETLIGAIVEMPTERVNVSNAMTNFTVETSYNKISDFINIVDKEPCKATVVVEPKIESRSFSKIPLRFLNLSEKLEVTGPLPEFSIKLKGNIPDFNKYNSSKNPVRIDMSKITEPGIYELPLIIPVPKGFELVEQSQNIITVTVAEKIVEPADENKNEEEIVG